MASELSMKFDLITWEQRRKDLSNPSIDLNLYNDLITLFVSQLLIDKNAPESSLSISGAALFAPRIGSSTDRHGHQQPAKQIAKRLFDAEEHHCWGNDAQKDTQIRQWASMRYSQTLARLSKRIKAALQHEEQVRLERLSIVQAHVSKARFADLKKRPIADEVRNPMAMPVYQADLKDFLPFFHFLQSNQNPFIEQPIDVPEGAALDEDQLEFQRGVFYRDGRMDLCKQSVIQHIGELMNALTNNTHIRHFLLGNNIIGIDGARAISQFINQRNDQPVAEGVKTWYLAGGNLDAECIGLLVDAWINDRSVGAVWLKRNPVRFEGAQHLARLLQPRSLHSIRILDLDNCGLMDSGASALFDALQNNHTVRHLYLSANGITAVGALSIAKYLHHINDTSDSLGLRTLVCSVNRIGDEGVIAIAEALKNNTHMKRLMLSSNQIESEGAIALARAMEQNNTLEALDLGLWTSTADLGELPNRIEDAGAFALAKMLTINTSLRILVANHNGLTINGFLNAAEILQNNQTSICHFELVERDLPGSEKVSEQIKAKLAENIERLYQMDKHQFYKDVFPGIRNIPSARYILSMYRTRDFRRQARKNMVKRWPAQVTEHIESDVVVQN